MVLTTEDLLDPSYHHVDSLHIADWEDLYIVLIHVLTHHDASAVIGTYLSTRVHLSGPLLRRLMHRVKSTCSHRRLDIR